MVVTHAPLTICWAQVKNNDSLLEVIRRALTLTYGSAVAVAFKNNIDQKLLEIPSATTLSRTRLVLDVLLCRQRQLEWREPGQFFLYLSMDSSPQNGLDYLLCLQDVVQRKDAARLMRCIDGEDSDDDLDSFLFGHPADNSFLRTSILPLGIVASGNCDVPAKFECLFHTLKLECGAEAGIGREWVQGGLEGALATFRLKFSRVVVVHP